MDTIARRERYRSWTHRWGYAQGGGRGTEEEDAPTEEGLADPHHCSGMGAVDVPGGDADSKEVSRGRSGGGEGAILTQSKITMPGREASAVNPAKMRRRARRGGGIVNDDENNNNDAGCHGGGGA